jgi:hypothetical protein
LEIQPETANKAVSIVETDVKVDFAPPVGYKEPEPQKPAPPPKPIIVIALHLSHLIPYSNHTLVLLPDLIIHMFRIRLPWTLHNKSRMTVRAAKTELPSLKLSPVRFSSVRAL